MTDKLFSTSDCYNLTNKEIRELYKKYVNPSIEHLFGAFAAGEEDIDHAEGIWIHTKTNGKILDVTGGIGVLSHGHNHPRILQTRIDFQEKRKWKFIKQFFLHILQL